MRLFDENGDVDAHLGDEARDGAPHGAHLERDQVVDHLRGEGRFGAVAAGFELSQKSFKVYTLCGVRSIVMFCFVFILKFRLPIWLHSSCSISPTAGGTFQKCSTKYHD